MWPPDEDIRLARNALLVVAALAGLVCFIAGALIL